MKKTICFLVFISVSCFALAACGKKNEQLPTDPAPAANSDSALHASLPGTMSDGIKANLSSSLLEDCDRKDEAAAKTIVNAVEGKAGAIDQFEKNNAPKSTDVKAGDLIFLKVERAVPQAGWKETQLSWTLAKSLHEKVKDTDVSADWLELRNEARALLINDRRRLVLAHNLGLGKDAADILARATKAAEDCGADPNCEHPGFDSPIADFLDSNAMYSKLIGWIDSQLTHNGRRAYLEALMKRLEFDKAQIYDFKANGSIVRDGTALTVPLDGGTLADDLMTLLQDGWKNDTVAAKAFFAKPKPGYFKIEMASGPGPGMTFVDVDNRLVHLAPGIDVRRIAHEFGHVLGFRDRRYDVWNPKTCSYAVQTREDDIMSSPETGSVLADDLATLDKTYPKSGVAKPNP